MDLQVRAVLNVQTVIHRVHQAHIRIQINHLTHNQKQILDIHHFHRLVQFIHFHFTPSFSFIHSPYSEKHFLFMFFCWEYHWMTIIMRVSLIFPANWTEFLPPPPEHPPPLPLANCAQPMGMCYVPTSPGSMRRVAPWASAGIPNHQKWVEIGSNFHSEW